MCSDLDQLDFFPETRPVLQPTFVSLEIARGHNMGSRLVEDKLLKRRAAVADDGWEDLLGDRENMPVLFAWVYVNTESILMPVLFHAAINTTLGTLGVLGQSDGDFRLLILNTVLTWVMVGIVVAVYGSDLKRERLMMAQNTDPNVTQA